MKSRIILAGGSGFLGTALARTFLARGDDVVILTRSPKPRGDGAREVAWDGATAGAWAAEMNGALAVINLSGKSVDCRYTPANRRALIDSRVRPTRVLGEVIARCEQPPRVWLNASSATIYRHTFGPAWDESAADFAATPEAKDEFSLDIIRAWEGALRDASTPATRKVALRITLALGLARNSVFPVLRRLARFGLGGRMGSGRQFVSWIHEQDLCRAVAWIVDHDELSGPVNLAAPEPLTNADMMHEIRAACGVPFGLPAAAWMLEVGAFFLRTETELILKSRRVVPGKLLASGFQFDYPTFHRAVADLEARARRG